jgi:flavin reductase (DIM6/NTAB) family NADH-FMN oxidoreductase RutF
MTDFAEILPQQLDENVFKLIGTDWMLITAGGMDSSNTMTASWGGLGVLWNKNVCFCVIRPQRYTYEFMEKSQYFTLSFFDSDYRKALELCGTKSGRDIDKYKETGLTPVRSGCGTVYFQEARIVLECRKMYFQDIDPANFVDRTIEDNYPGNDYHRMYIGEIVKCMVKD